jgi:hypothetical protein
MRPILSKAFTTHIPLLIKTFQMTSGTVLEVGAGLYSTPLLHWLCTDAGRSMYTYEASKEYFDYAKRYQSHCHTVRFVEDWKKFNLGKKHFSMAFVDHDGDRAGMALFLRDKVDYIVMHDTEVGRIYGYDKIWKHFKYRYDWKLSEPYTTVVSNLPINL